MSSQLIQQSASGASASQILIPNDLTVAGNEAIIGNLSVSGQVSFANPPKVTYPVNTGTNCTWIQLGSVVMVFGQGQNNPSDGTITISGFPAVTLSSAVATPNGGANVIVQTLGTAGSGFTPSTVQTPGAVSNNASLKFAVLNVSTVSEGSPATLTFTPYLGSHGIWMYAVFSVPLAP